MNKSDKKAVTRLKQAVEDLTNHNFTFYFFVIDCKNVPNGSFKHIYQMAKHLYDNNHNVKMVYQLENEYSDKELNQLKIKNKPYDENRVFTGVGEWLGEDYMKIPHMNISKEEWKVSPSDFLFIPEAFSSLMKQTYQYKAPCKRIIIVHNTDYIMDFIPFNDEWGTYGIHDAIVTNQAQKNLIKSIFPYVRCETLNPFIEEYFRKPVLPKKLIVNIVSKETSDVNKLMKMFYWKYPMYKFISFRDLRGYPSHEFADYLKESAITIWIDQNTPFGYSALESMKCGNIVIGKVPEHIPEWMLDEGGNIINSCVWFYDINKLPDIIAKVVGSWMQSSIPNEVYDNMENITSKYTQEQWVKNFDNLIDKYINERINEFETIKKEILNKDKNNAK